MTRAAMVALALSGVLASAAPQDSSSSSSSSSSGSSSSSSSSSSSGGNSSWDGARRNLLLFNPGDLFNGFVTLEYERALTSFLGLQVGLSVLSFRGVFDPPVRANVIAIAPEIALRVHLIRPAPAGLWFGPSFSGAYIVPNSDTPPRAFGYGFGAAIGYNFTLGPLVLQVGVGGAVHDYGEGFIWSPRFRLGLGFLF